jgi:hypothetical protein
MLQKTKSEGQRRELQGQLTRLQQQLSEEKVHRKAQQLQSEWKVGSCLDRCVGVSATSARHAAVRSSAPCLAVKAAQGLLFDCFIKLCDTA